MQRILWVMRWFAAAAVVIAASLLCWQCIDIYRTGINQYNGDQNDVYLASIYSLDGIASRLHDISVPLILCTVVIGSNVVISFAANKSHKDSHCRMDIQDKGSWELIPKVKPGACFSKAPSALALIRTAVLVLALLFIVLGVMNGGLFDVLVKAINICTECIGLG